MPSKRPVPVAVPPDETLEAMLVGYCLHPPVRQLVVAAVETLDDSAVCGKLAPVWHAIREIVLSGNTPTVPTVAERLEPPWTLSQVLDLVRDDIAGWELASAIDALVELSRRRSVMSSLARAWEAAGKSADDAMSIVREALDKTASAQAAFPTLAELAEWAMRAAQLAAQARDSHQRSSDMGLPTGIWPLDAATGGMSPGDLWVLAARTSVGKTSFALQIAELQSVPVHFCSAEVPAPRLGRKALSSHALVPIPRMRQGFVEPSEWERMAAAVERLAKTQVVVDDRSRTLEQLRLAVMRTARKYAKVGLVVVDYLQLLAPDQGVNQRALREERVAAVSRGLKLLAMDLEVPVLALAQLSRAAEDGQDPELRHLRESGAIEQDADIVVFLHRPKAEDADVDSTDAESMVRTDVIVAKNRDGPLAKIPCAFDPLTQTLVDHDTLMRRHARDAEAAQQAGG